MMAKSRIAVCRRMLCVFIVGILLSAGSREAEARLTYFSVFARQYPNLKDLAKKAKCTICHPAKDNKKKKIRNNYGKALEKALGQKNVKKKLLVEKALKKIESEPSAIKGMTFGDLIKAGKLPAATE